MKPSRRVSKILLSAVAGFLVWHPSLASATTYYWDVNGNANGIGGGALSTDWPSAHWSTSAAGNINTVAWPNTNPNTDQAYFGGSVGTVTINAPVNVNSIDFEVANYFIIPDGANYLTLSGASPSIAVNLPIVSGQTTANITAPITGTAGFTLTGNNNLGGGLKFLQLGNTSTTSINNFSGMVTVAANGALRLSGGTLTEQIGDNADMTLYGVIDFASGTAGKQEKLRNVLVSGSAANFSASGGTHFIVNSMTATNANGPSGIALNGNNATLTQLTVNGWADGNATLTLNDGTLRFNGTGGAGATGSAANLGGDIIATGNSFIWNQNGGGAGTATTNSFTYQNLNFTAAASTINVASGGTLNITSARVDRPVVITSPIGGVALVKTGPGDLLMTYGVEGNATFGFTGSNEVREGTWTIGANERLADASTLTVSGGTFRLQGFKETVGAVILSSGTISGTGTATLASTASFDLRSGYIEANLNGANKPLVKSTSGTVVLKGSQTYTGSTTVNGGTVSLQGNLASPTLTISAGKVRSEPWNTLNDPRGTNRFSALSIAPGAQLDLTSNAMILDYTSPGTLVDDLRQQIASGRIAYLGMADYRLGYADNQLLGVNTFAGMDVSSHNNVLLKYTYAGDANLDGQVDIKDLFQLAQSWQSSGTWFNGDFNYDGIINAKDLGLLAVEWQAGAGNPLPGASFDSALASLNLPAQQVPEPAATGLLSISAAWLLKRTRPRKRGSA